jgi:hypothetical protein
MEEQVIDMALAMDMWVFGGYVRDVIVRGQKKFGDIDLCCSDSKTSVDQFIRILGTRFDVTNVRTRKFGHMARYGRMSRGIKRVERFLLDNRLHVDVVVYDGTFTDWCNEESVDFTSNLFYKSWDTGLGIRYAPGRFKHMANPLGELVKMTQAGIFERIWDATSDYSTHMHVLQICNRARDLVKRGFTFKGSLISSLMELKLLGHDEITDECRSIESDLQSFQIRRTTRETMKCIHRSGLHLPEEIYEAIEVNM